MSDVSIAEITLEAARALRQAGVPDARREAASLLGHAMGRDRTYLITHPDEGLGTAVVAGFRTLIERRARGEPLQYIMGHTEFFGLDFEVTPDVLIPRPETELLVETALDLLGGRGAPSLCDVGTGSGCIAVSILHRREDVRALGVDISVEALGVARRNAARHKTEARFAPVLSDCLSAIDPVRARFSMIVSNPPYVAENALAGLQREVRDFEPRVALSPGRDGLSIIRRLLQSAPPYLESGGHLLLEIGFDQHEAVRHLVDSRTWEFLNIQKDLQGIPRTVVIRKR